MTGLARPLLAGVDVGGTKVAALLVDADGQLLARAVRSMVEGGRPLGIEPVVGAVEAALAAAGATADDLGAIGIGVPGGVDPEDGVVRHATNLEWVDVPLASHLERAFGAPCHVENDVRLAAAGLIGHDVAGGARSLAYVAVGTGIGAGLVLDGRLYRGERGVAGEIGHVIVDPAGPACRCGQNGCLEAIASGPAIARQAEDALTTGTQLGARRRRSAHLQGRLRRGPRRATNLRCRSRAPPVRSSPARSRTSRSRATCNGSSSAAAWRRQAPSSSIRSTPSSIACGPCRRCSPRCCRPEPSGCCPRSSMPSPGEAWLSPGGRRPNPMSKHSDPSQPAEEVVVRDVVI